MSDPPSANVTTSPSFRVPAYPAKQSSPTRYQQHSFSTSPSASDPNDSLAFIRSKHSQALCWISNFKLAAPSLPDDVDAKRSAAKLALEQLGYTWPDILDATPPLAGPTSANNLDYEIITIEYGHSIVIGLLILIVLLVGNHISPF